jgi:hypothetical protein
MLREIRIFFNKQQAQLVHSLYPQLKQLNVPVLLRPSAQSICYCRYDHGVEKKLELQEIQKELL